MFYNAIDPINLGIKKMSYEADPFENYTKNTIKVKGRYD